MQAGVVHSLNKEAATYMGVPAKLHEPSVHGNIVSTIVQATTSKLPILCDKYYFNKLFDLNFRNPSWLFPRHAKALVSFVGALTSLSLLQLLKTILNPACHVVSSPMMARLCRCSHRKSLKPLSPKRVAY